MIWLIVWSGDIKFCSPMNDNPNNSTMHYGRISSMLRNWYFTKKFWFYYTRKMFIWNISRWVNDFLLNKASPISPIHYQIMLCKYCNINIVDTIPMESIKSADSLFDVLTFGHHDRILEDTFACYIISAWTVISFSDTNCPVVFCFVCQHNGHHVVFLLFRNFVNTKKIEL